MHIEQDTSWGRSVHANCRADVNGGQASLNNLDAAINRVDMSSLRDWHAALQTRPEIDSKITATGLAVKRGFHRTQRTQRSERN